MCKEVSACRHEIRQVRMPDGELLYLLALAETGVPDPYVTRFMLAQVRQSGVSSGTLRRLLDDLRIGIEFLTERGIDIEERIAAGRFLDTGELGVLATRCRARADGQGSVTGPVAVNRFSVFVSYVAFRVEEVMAFCLLDQRQVVAVQLQEFRKRAGRVAPRSTSGAAANERLGLEANQRARLLEVLDPDHPENPFRPKNRVRNQAMILLPYLLGLRAGEEFGLKGKDFDTRTNPATITVHRRPDDPDETRKVPPLAKTLSRTLHVEGLLRRVMDAWIKDRQDRAKYPKARKHPFIFVATDGAPITLRGARAVYERLRSVHPELAAIGQHVLRHDVNDRWVEQNEEKGFDATEARQDQCYVMGWSSTSRQPDHYPKAAIRRRANRRIAALQSEMVGDA